MLHDKGDLARTNANVGFGFFTNQETGKMFGNKLNLLVTGFDTMEVRFCSAAYRPALRA